MAEVIGREELRNIIREELKEVKQELEGVKQELGEMKQELEGIKRQVELQDLSFRALVKVAKISEEDEEDFAGISVREGTGFNTTRVKRVRSPLI